MNQPPQSSARLRLFVVLALVVAGLGWLMLGVAGNDWGMHALPDAEGSRVDSLADPVAGFALADVVAKPESAWHRWDGRGYIQSFYGEAVWVRVTLKNPKAAPVRGILADPEFYTDHIDLWTRDETVSSEWIHEQAGEWVPAREKALWGRNAAFFVDVPARSERVAYLRATDYFGVWLRPVWWPDERTFLAAQLRDTAVEGCYFGIVFALLVYNSVLWVRLRFQDIGYYLCYLVALAVFMFIVRTGHQVLGIAIGSPNMETLLMFAMGMSGVFLAQFARVFFNLNKMAPRCDRVVRVLMMVMIVLAVGGLTTPWTNNTIWLHYTVACVAATHVILFLTALVAWRAGARQARYFILSFGVLFVGVIPTAGIWLASVPLGVAELALMLGSALEMLLLSLAVSDRFAQIQRDKLAAQERLVEEAEQRRTMQEAYADELEVEVRERTGELEAASADKDRMIAVLGHDLRSPLTGLTQAAEQLRGGLMAAEALGAPASAAERFVNEAARTGRQLLLMIEDLVLWARLRAGGVHLAAHEVGALVLPVVALNRVPAKLREVELVVEIEAGVMVKTDRVLAQTLVRNLLTNALKFARRRVVVRVKQTPAGVRLSVRDDGPGLPAAVAARVAGNAPWPAPSDGSLGLMLCDEISRALGTRLAAVALAEGGTEFGFVMPVAMTEVTP